MTVCGDRYDVWVSKPVYEAVPYIYGIAGAILFGLSMYLDFWWLPTLCLILGIVCLVYGLVLWLRRRDYRTHRTGNDDPLG